MTPLPIEYYLPIVVCIAQRMRRCLPRSVDLDDLIGAGTVGLCEAARRYKSARHFKFETFCGPRIRGAMLDALRADDWVPRAARDRGETPPRWFSLHQRIAGQRGESTIGDSVVDPRGQRRTQEIDEWEHLCYGLSARESLILSLRYRGGMTLRAIGEVIHLSESWVCRELKRIIRLMKEKHGPAH